MLCLGSLRSLQPASHDFLSAGWRRELLVGFHEALAQGADAFCSGSFAVSLTRSSDWADLWPSIQIERPAMR